MLLRIDRNPAKRALRWFAGLWFPLFVLVVVLWLGKLAPAIPWHLWLGVPAAALALLGVAVPGAIRWLYLGLLYVTWPIGFVVSTVVMFVLFYLVITPIGFLMRLSGRDPLQKSFDPDARSYWHERPPRPDPDQYFKQF